MVVADADRWFLQYTNSRGMYLDTGGRSWLSVMHGQTNLMEYFVSVDEI